MGVFTLPAGVDPVVKARGRVSAGSTCPFLLRDGLMSDLKVAVGDGLVLASSSKVNDWKSTDSIAC